ncbi:helix-turn-helix domain-containing protein [Antrihabitans cavernicola]|uniref:Helix-turn-helix transcriptional regulator n=1 Tax=Antrihabitans cavernicola TaxID=2495913 RepID=A0A5A7SDB6_9NOCA|nr:helix-turn-helix transcriptional regulator [Spelaeibacter cavernicola]KAA0024148.1 helix-turn-helix transcriptional regulator [Spelaeibacter cavernicola]
MRQPDDPEHFARHVNFRREQLGLSHKGLKAAGGPAPPTTSKAENGKLDPRPETFAKLDRGLSWTPGSAAYTWHGGEPTPLELAMSTPLQPTPDSQPVAMSAVLALVSAYRRMVELDEADPGPISHEAFTDVRRQTGEAVSAVTGALVTDILERHSRTDAVTPLTNDLIEFALRDYMALPVVADEPNREEKLYRRWLVGRAGDIEPSLRRKFRRRLDRKLHRSEGVQRFET